MASHQLIKEVGSNIKQLRLAKNSGQTEVAKALDISVAALSKIENGLTDLNLSRLVQIARYFEVPVTAIIAKGVLPSASKDNSIAIEALHAQIAEKDAELMRLQRKVIELYEKLTS